MNKQVKVKLYAKALAEILSARKEISAPDKKKIVNNFVKLLIDTECESKSKEILELAEDLILAEQGKSKITFETARELTPSQKKMLDSFVKKGDVVKEKINPELIAGVRIIINDSKQFDASMQSKLQKLYGGRNN